MKCPYCDKEITITSGFCPECGQNITNSVVTKKADTYWSEVNKDDEHRNLEQKRLERQIATKKMEQKKKTDNSFVIVGIVIVAAVLGFIMYQAHSQKLVSEIKENLVGKKFIAYDEHMEGLGWIHYEYWQLTFKDDSSLDYAYIETVGPRDKDEGLVYKGTYRYTLSRSITGAYSIKTNGETYKLRVNDENIPQGISK